MIEQRTAVTDLQDILADGLRHHQAGHLARAEFCYRQILTTEPRHADGWHLFGLIAHQTARSDVAILLISRAISLNGQSPIYHSNLGKVLQDLEHLGKAANAYRVALCLNPTTADAQANLGVLLKGFGFFKEAVAIYGAALRLKPDVAEVLSNLGNALKGLGSLDEAASACRAALCLKPVYAEAYSNLGNALRDLGRLNDACAAYEFALLSDSDYAEAHYNRGLALLLVGRWVEGWKDYEWRWRTKEFLSAKRCFGKPYWQGESLAQKTILLHAEQGMGDAIQFSRYAPLVAAQAGRVILQVHRPLLRLFNGLPGVDCLVAAGEPPPEFDVQCSLMSLPHIFGTTPDKVPPVLPLNIDEARIARWENRARSPNRQIGIVWQGNPKYAADPDRSVPLALFAPLAKVPGVDLISLQKGYGVDQIDLYREPLRLSLLGPDFDVDDVMETAAPIATLDLVISVDTAVAHLAGTIGVPVWLVLPVIPESRWLLDRHDTPWYPTMRLFRQKQRGDWQDVFERMAMELQAMTVNGLSPFRR